MISIRLDYSADLVLQYLNDAIADISMVTKSDSHAAAMLNAYNQWANKHLRTLGTSIEPHDVNRLITTARYWSLQTVDPGAYGSPLLDTIRNEMSERFAALSAAHRELYTAVQAWKDRGTVMAVLDTNVLLRHHSQLATFEWHSALGVRPHLPILLWVPIAVVAELDKMKQATGNMRFGAETKPRRELARAALKTLNSMFYAPDIVVPFAQGSGTPVRSFSIALLVDEPGHIRLQPVDSELIDRAASLTPVSLHSYVVTYDQNMAFTARSMGVGAVLLPEPDDA